MKALALSVGDIVEVPNHTGSTIRYEVTGIFLAVKIEDSSVGLYAFNSKGRDSAFIVPCMMIDAGVSVGIFTHTPKDKL